MFLDVHQIKKNVGNPLAQALFNDWLNPSIGSNIFRSSYKEQKNINKSTINQKQDNQINILLPFLYDLADNSIQQQFQKHFMFGVAMQIWRKGRFKKVMVFIDPNIQTFLWISSNTKAFLFDMCYTTISRNDYELERVTKIKDIIVLRSFGEEIPFLFRGEARNQINTYLKLFQRYIFWNKAKNVYPPYFSRIMRLYSMQIVKDSISYKKTASDIIKVAQMIELCSKEKSNAILSVIHNHGNIKGKLTDKTELVNSQIISFLKIIQCNDNLKLIYQKYTKITLQNQMDYLTTSMHKQTFAQFLHHQQQQPPQNIALIISQTRQQISFYDLCSYLQRQSVNYAAYAPEVDESLPLTDYYCYSSHNTYLCGNQLTSDSKIERYVQDLMGGLKCVEIDVHNDGEVPIITHAVRDKSFCKPIDFQQTIKQINRFCQNHPNHYPIILSIENHAKDENRYKMVNILTRHFQKKIMYLLQEYKQEEISKCRNLEYLRGKIIIKTDSKIQQMLGFKPNNALIQNTRMSKFMLPYKYEQNRQFQNKDFQKKYNSFQEFARQLQQRKNRYQMGLKNIFLLPMSQMTKVTSIFKSPKGIEHQTSCGYQCTSLTNKKAQHTNQDKLITYTKRSWLRIYPQATQISSSNYNPIPHLRVGAQIIALNTQTKDQYAFIMMSYFTAGRQLKPSNIGYIDKPQHLRSSIKTQRKQTLYQIKTLSPKKIKIRFLGSEHDMKLNVQSTNTFKVKDHWQGFLIFETKNGHKDCIPLRFIRKGYRVLVVKNQIFLDSGVRILVHITIK